MTNREKNELVCLVGQLVTMLDKNAGKKCQLDPPFVRHPDDSIWIRMETRDGQQYERPVCKLS